MTRFFVLSFFFAACAAEPDAIDRDLARLEAQLADVPGELVITRSSELPFDDDALARLAHADKVIHIFSDGTLAGFVGPELVNPPEGVSPRRVFRDLEGDIAIGDHHDLARRIERREPLPVNTGVSQAQGLDSSSAYLWVDGTVAYTIDSSFYDPTDIAVIQDSISKWNTSRGPNNEPLRVRFVPRYAGDNRPYVRFVRGGIPDSLCGLSQVGRYDNWTTNWFSHDIYIHKNCVNRRTVMHEMAHTAGLYHEHQRCDRDQFVVAGIGTGDACVNMCEIGDQQPSKIYGAYNYLSLMHYSYGGLCALSQRVPATANYRGQPWDAGSAYELDTYDVLALNQIYQAQPRPSLPRLDAYYSLMPQFTSRVLGVPASSQANNVQLILWDRIANTGDQQFQIVPLARGGGYVELRPRHAPNKCIEDYAFSTANGAAIKQWDCWGGDNQAWIIAPSTTQPGYYDLVNKYSGKSLDVTGWNAANGTPIQQWDHTNGTNQRFALWVPL